MLTDGNDMMMDSFDLSVFNENHIDDVFANLIEENISDNITNENMPFTIEAYARLFAELMDDDYV